MISFIRTLFISAALSLGLSSCALVLCLIDTDVSNKPRFKNVAGREVLTRKTLYLEAPDNRRPEKLRHVYDLVTTNVSHEGTTILIPAGHPVKITKVIRQHDIGDSSEDMYGEVTLNGKTYPMKYFLGFTSSPNAWREIYNMFVIKE